MGATKSRTVLLFALIFNLISTALHYTDNALFVDKYPEPEWITTAGVFVTLAFMTPFGILGYWLYTRRVFSLAYLCLGFYSLTSLSSPAHYLYPMMAPMSAKMHLLIWGDAIAGILLLSFVLWSALVQREWRRREAS